MRSAHLEKMKSQKTPGSSRIIYSLLRSTNHPQHPDHPFPRMHLAKLGRGSGSRLI